MRSELWAGLLGGVAVVAGAACGEDEGVSTTGYGSGDGGSTTSVGGGGGATSTASVGGQGGGGMDAGYPAGPYGNEVGDTFPQLTWEGYLSTDPAALATEEDWTDAYTSLDLHESGADYALVHTSLSF